MMTRMSAISAMTPNAIPVMAPGEMEASALELTPSTNGSARG